MKTTGGSRPAQLRPEKDFRDQAIKDALDKTVRSYRPETTRRSRLGRIAIVAALAILAVAAYGTLLQYSTPRPAPKEAERKPVTVELLPAR